MNIFEPTPIHDGLTPVETTLMERYLITCAGCQYERQIFGTRAEAHTSAERMGWEFRTVQLTQSHEATLLKANTKVVETYCPHCKLLPTAPPKKKKSLPTQEPE